MSNSISPWADHRARIDSATFERKIATLLAEAGQELAGFRVEHQEMIRTADGAYRIDVTARFSVLDVNFLVLIECKDHARPVEREDVQILADKLRAAGAQKGMLFSTNGFQKGAIEYARFHGIALVRFIEGALTYETRSEGAGAPPKPPPWANIPEFVAQMISIGDDGACHVSVVESGRFTAIREFLTSA
jgi:restriction system protein